MPKKVLLIDYEPRSVDRVRTLLEGSEYGITVAKDGEEGLSVVAAATFDVILLAGMLPRLPSAEVIREIRRKGGATAPPILLMVSGYHGSNPKADAQRVGAFDIVVKPYTDEALRAAVRAAVDSTDVSARTMRIPTAELLKSASLTSDDIFSDVLQDVGGDKPSAAARAASAAAATDDAVEKRLRDTLSGILGKSAPPPAPHPAAAPATPPPTRFSTDADIDRMISDTLSGLKTPGAPSLSVPVSPEPPPQPPPPPALRPRVDVTPARGLIPPAGPAPLTPPPSRSPAASRPESASAVRSSGSDRFGNYEVLERIAAGGMAELSKARLSGAEGFQKIVAIKKILPHLADNDEFIAMFADEAKLAAQLNHPNIVHIFDLGKIESGGYFIAMEYVEGRDLRAILQSGKEVGTPLPPPLAVYVASKIAAALDYAHRRRDAEGHDLNIVHRDVSPPNILISYEGDIKLCDFGIAKAASKASQTQSGALKGKVQYMSPEQAWGRPLDRRSDIFSLGCVLFEMLTEQKLFRGDTDLSVLEKVRAAEVVAPSTINPEVPRSLDAVVLKALARESDDRYANASDMLRDLEAVLYAYSPAPGSADLAIYLHRLQAEEAAVAESRAREASRSATAPQPERKRKSKGAPVARRTTGSIPASVVAAATAGAGGSFGSSGAPGGGFGRKDPTSPGVYGASPVQKLDAERKSRAPLYGAIAIAVALLAAAVVYVIRKPATATAPVTTKATPLPAAPVPTAAPPPSAVSPAPSSVDPRAIEEEVQRQLSARKKELQKALEPPKPAHETGAPAPAPGAAAHKPEKTEEAPPPPAAAAKEKEKEKEPTPEPPKASAEPVRKNEEPEPTAVPPPPRQAPAPVRAAEARDEVVRGELTGPGPGVVEPALLSTPHVVYPAMARQQRITGKVVVLVLVTEDGTVADSRLQQGLGSKTGVNEAVLAAVRRSKFRPATKNGTPVKMWRTVVVDVTP